MSYKVDHSLYYWNWLLRPFKFILFIVWKFSFVNFFFFTILYMIYYGLHVSCFSLNILHGEILLIMINNWVCFERILLGTRNIFEIMIKLKKDIMHNDTNNFDWYNIKECYILFFSDTSVSSFLSNKHLIWYDLRSVGSFDGIHKYIVTMNRVLVQALRII